MSDKEKQFADLLKEMVGFNKETITALVKETSGNMIGERVNELAEGLSNILTKFEESIDTQIKKATKHLKATHKEVHLIKDGKTRVVKGHTHPMYEKAIKLCRHPKINLLLVGPSGCGKTHMAMMIAEGLGLKHYCQGCCEDTTKGTFVGINLPNEYIPGTVERVMRDGGLLLIDEFDALNANVALIINAALSNGYMVNARGEVVKQHDDCVIIVSANTFGRGADRLFCGRNQLDAATMERVYALDMDYDTDFETQIGTKELCDFVWGIRAKAIKNRVRISVGSRWIEKGQAAMDCGVALKEVQNDLTSHLSMDERKQVGLTPTKSAA